MRRAKALPAAEFDEVFAESLTTMTSGLANLNTVIARFSDFARMPPPESATVAPNDVVRQSVQLFRAQLEAPGRPPIALAVDLDDSVGTIRADSEQLGRAVQNLLLNAIDAMPAGGDLAVRRRRANGGVRIEVSDTGEGLTEEERQRLFTPYYTTKQHGTGLGLAIVQSVVADHSGKVWVVRQVLSGRQPPVAAAPAAGGSGTLSERVTAYEREVVVRELTAHGYRVAETARALGLERSHLYKKCQQLGIDLKNRVIG
jgi:signal transduction histidine kinase